MRKGEKKRGDTEARYREYGRSLFVCSCVETRDAASKPFGGTSMRQKRGKRWLSMKRIKADKVLPWIYVTA